MLPEGGFTMSNCSRGKQPQAARQCPVRTGSGEPSVRSEPEMRRWPHPVTCAPEFPDLPAALHYIHCSLSYQNQLLSEIRALLEALSSGSGDAGRPHGK